MDKLLKTFTLVLFLVAFLAACALGGNLTSARSAPGVSNPYAPQPGDGSLVRGGVEIVKTEAVATGSPAQVQLTISYFTPTPCHKFRLTVGKPDAGKRIDIEAYSLMKTGQVCTLMRLATPSVADLDLGSLPGGHYTVWINGSQVTEFDA